MTAPAPCNPSGEFALRVRVASVAAQGSWRWLPQLRHSRWDAFLVSLALLHGIVLLSWPSILLIALGFFVLLAVLGPLVGADSRVSGGWTPIEPGGKLWPGPR